MYTLENIYSAVAFLYSTYLYVFPCWLINSTGMRAECKYGSFENDQHFGIRMNTRKKIWFYSIRNFYIVSETLMLRNLYFSIFLKINICHSPPKAVMFGVVFVPWYPLALSLSFIEILYLGVNDS